MGDRSAIQWTGATWNPTTGCDRTSPGCDNCYALTLAARLKAMGQPKYQADGDPRTSGPGFGFAVHWDKLLKPPRFPAGARVFVNSMSDVFHEDAPLEAIAALWAVFLAQPEVAWLVLTKRADRMREVLNDRAWWESVGARSLGVGRDDVHVEWYGDLLPAPANVWLGVTVENRAFVGRADDLRATPAAVRFISAEPLLGPLVRPSDGVGCACGWPLDACSPTFADGGACDRIAQDGPHLDLTGIDWLIAGGESSGRVGRRLVDENNEPRLDRIGWVRDLRDACVATRWPCNCCQIGGHAPECDSHSGGTAFFFKQFGGRKPTSGGRTLDGRTWDEFPRQPLLTLTA